MLGNPKYFILSIDEMEYYVIRDQRFFINLDPERKEFDDLEQGDEILVYIQQHKKIMAQLEVMQIDENPDFSQISLEPIYNAPPHEGVALTITVLTQLLDFEKIQDWIQQPEMTLKQIQDQDYKFISSRLIG